MKVESLSIGNSRYPNEDRLIVQDMGAYGIVAILADGMGGLSLGDLAADLVTKTMARHLREYYQGYAEQDVLYNALACADKEVRQASMTSKSNLGAAVAAVIVVGNKLHCTWQGNVRVYVRNSDKMILLTTDHIADVGYGGFALTRCIKGAGLREDVPYLCHELDAGDEVYICTDGLYKAVGNDWFRLQIGEMKARINSPADDATLIKITI